MSQRLSVFILLLGVAVVGAGMSTESRRAPQEPDQQPRQRSEIEIVIRGGPGAPPRYAVPDFVPLSNDPDTTAIAKTIGQVLWDDLAFEREFYMIPRDTYASIPPARSLTDIPYDRWRELGTDALVAGTVQRTANGVRVEVRLISVQGRQSVFSREYSGPASNPRFFAHTIADEIHMQQRGLRGVARTKLAFASDRDRERVLGTVEKREVKEIYISDYDGANQRRVTVNRTLNIAPVWSPDGRALVYTSYRRGFPDLFVSHIYDGKQEQPTGGTSQNYLASWSPDGNRIAFTSNRDGNAELYVMDRSGGNVRRITNHPAIDTTPTWSPTGTQLAFTSDRTGRPQIYVVGADGLNPRMISRGSAHCDRATWSPAPFNELAYVCRSGPGFDIFIYDFASGETRQITFGEGTNESPSYAPNGRHLAFVSTRSKNNHIYTIGRDGRGLRQVTRVGNNYMPDWSR